MTKTNATKEGARFHVGAWKTGGCGNDSSSSGNSIKCFDSTTPRGVCQDDTRRNFTTHDIFQRVKDALTMPEVAEMYGYTPNRAGFIRCPFHGGGNERTPSLHLKEHYFKCFGCQESGDAVTFVEKLFSLSPMDALKKLNTDFNLGLSLDRHKPTREELEAAKRRREIRDTARRFQDWRNRAEWALATAAGVGEGALRDKTPDQWTETECLAIRQIPWWDYLRDILMDGDETECAEVLRDWPVIGADIAKVVSVDG